MRGSSTAAKAVVAGWFASMSSRDYDALPTYFYPDATFWISGNPDRVPDAGIKPALDQMAALPSFLDKFDEYRYDIMHILGEGPDVIVEGMVVATVGEELVYVNNITTSFVVGTNGLIKEVREYPDHVESAWLQEWFDAHPDIS